MTMPARRRSRAGFTYAEVQIAFAVLGISLAGLAPLVVAQLLLMERIEDQVYCLYPAEYELAPDGDGTTLVLRPRHPGAGEPTDEELWRRALGATSAGWSLRVVEVSDARTAEHRELRLETFAFDHLYRWSARRAPHTDGLRWTEQVTGTVQDPEDLDSRPTLKGPDGVAIEELDRANAVAEVTIP
jgi:hypothetical protein